ncbi:tryptophan synthase subunit alpha [uncultured Rhodospira sp.]|uniref:tryptophan synthase subunit alpha n=1 Tax=uncultured Rhodospira sp. TaxID=1936189 RepID=UPI002601ED34|nr:tryptophan synthase subunit alpha [uncultured Rhodospira sp.]
MSAFFAHCGAGHIGLALFLNAGDPPFGLFEPLAMALDDAGVECLELAVPFPNSITDGPVVQRSARRALDNGADLNAVLAHLARLRPRLRHMKVALLADWSHTVRPVSLASFLEQVSGSGADGVLVHGLPPRQVPDLHEEAGRLSLPVVTSCYAASTPETMANAARQATAYLYLVSHYGRTGQSPPGGFAGLAPVIATLRLHCRSPIAVGFGVKAREHVTALRDAGADAAIVGSTLVARIEDAVTSGADPVAAALALVDELRPASKRPVPQREACT